MFNCVCNGRLHIKGNNSRKAGAATAVNGLRLKKMGVNSGSKLRYHLVGLSLSDVCSLARKRVEGAGRPGFPAVAFDVSWLCYTCRRFTAADTIEHGGNFSAILSV